MLHYFSEDRSSCERDVLRFIMVPFHFAVKESGDGLFGLFPE